jgi:hypothetical protein
MMKGEKANYLGRTGTDEARGAIFFGSTRPETMTLPIGRILENGLLAA